MIELFDGIFNSVAMILFIGSMSIALREFSKKRNVSSLTLVLLFLGATLFSLGNILDKFDIIDEMIADDIAEAFKIFFAVIGFFWIIIPLMEAKLKESEILYKNAYNRANFYKDLFTHDMNNILQSMLNSLELYYIDQNQLDDDKNVNQYISILKEQTDRAILLISNVQKLSNLESADFYMEKVEIIEVLNDALSFIEKNFPGKDIKITVQANDGNYHIQANELLLDVFENLLINSIKHNSNPTIKMKIKVSKKLRNNKREIKMSFIDNGRGIPDSRKEEIFKRSPEVKRSIEGMGMGLSLVKIIVDNFKGSIQVKDRIKNDQIKGSIFILYFPDAG